MEQQEFRPRDLGSLSRLTVDLNLIYGLEFSDDLLCKFRKSHELEWSE